MAISFKIYILLAFSYPPLTLPKNREVYNNVERVFFKKKKKIKLKTKRVFLKDQKKKLDLQKEKNLLNMKIINL